MLFLCLKSPNTPKWMNFKVLWHRCSPPLTLPLCISCLITTSQHSQRRVNDTPCTWHIVSASQMLIFLLSNFPTQGPYILYISDCRICCAHNSSVSFFIPTLWNIFSPFVSFNYISLFMLYSCPSSLPLSPPTQPPLPQAIPTPVSIPGSCIRSLCTLLPTLYFASP